jgi:ubiquinone/menaquinone biosynthesis C-methylase UbiE
LAAHKVGEDGKVVGIDFAPQMSEQAKQAVKEGTNWWNRFDPSWCRVLPYQ